jgi:hypothetical protein
MRGVLWDGLGARVTRVVPSGAFPGRFLVTIGEQCSVASLDDLRALAACLDEMIATEQLPAFEFDSSADLNALEGP